VTDGPRLILITSRGDVPTDRPAGPAPHRLASAIVEAARRWGSFASETSDVIETETDEGAARLALLDAVHDLEHAETNAAAPPARGMRPLFGDGAG
jgi:hypothetical protein